MIAKAPNVTAPIATASTTFRVAAIAAAVLMISALAMPLGAQQEAQGSAGAGHTYANAVCAQCHAIEAGQKSSPEVKAPPFSTMVRNAKLTPHGIDGWLVSSHKDMPDFSVPAEKRADLIAYIKSLALKQ
ncbi:MAG TPA: hypothetical protein PKD49_14210 [Hyphomicrobium sp.]|nr:hypothetical protein [Hyphomicrobium sp.]